MDQEFDVYVVFGVYVVHGENSREYKKVPLSINLSLAQAQYEWQQFEKWREWLPEGAKYLNCAVVPRKMKLYPDKG